MKVNAVQINTTDAMLLQLKTKADKLKVIITDGNSSNGNVVLLAYYIRELLLL